MSLAPPAPCDTLGPHHPEGDCCHCGGPFHEELNEYLYDGEQWETWLYCEACDDWTTFPDERETSGRDGGGRN